MTLGAPLAVAHAAGVVAELAAEVVFDLAGLGAALVLSREAKEPGLRPESKHQVTISIRQAQLPLDREAIGKMSLEVDGESAPIVSVMVDPPLWLIHAGGAS